MATVFINNSKNALSGNEKGIEKTILESCIKVQAQAKKLAPVADVNGGRLRGSISYSTKLQSEGDLDKVTSKDYGTVGTKVDYGVYQEFGTRNMPPQPFLRPSVGVLKNGATAQDIKDIMYQNMKQYLKDFKGGI